MFKKSIKLVCLVLLIGLFTTMVFGCTQNQPSKTEAPKETTDKPAGSAANKKLQIALIPKTLNNPFFISMEEGAKKAADEFGVDLIVQAADREVDVEKQMQIMENMITKKVDAILISPSGSKEIVPAIKKANDAGIPVLIVDTKVDEAAAKAEGAKTATFIGSDNYNGGQLAALYMIEQLKGKGKIAVIEGIAGHETSDARVGGFKDKIKESAPEIEIVASQTAQWERDKGYDVFQNILTANPDVQGVFAASDLMALGAVEAIAQAGKTGEIIVLGFDASDDAKTAIKEGTMNGSIAQYASEMGKLGVEKAVELLKGGSIENYIPTKVELITKDKIQ
ncbi:sugar ABC transporter substrate-binding protein [Petroclostridium sp. X23]|uniref:sugar ABC transporter substrate-binding protein n=1 Tax=Petroclostridium sp. X23 TaxID=3045146 RepID=UPI0024ACEE49|nr:sugar ABC transporter substrate-binding protein [Petroclostridium sp. X23]WHH61013.1 sugar ABC transporter substrate-binding protein [Petroclostridium sp. X23]